MVGRATTERQRRGYDRARRIFAPLSERLFPSPLIPSVAGLNMPPHGWVDNHGAANQILPEGSDNKLLDRWALVPAELRERTRPPRDPCVREAKAGIRELLEISRTDIIRKDRIRRDAEFYEWCVRCALREGIEAKQPGRLLPFNRTWAQIAVAVKHPTTGDPEVDRERFSTQCRRALDSLQTLGLIEYGQIFKPNGQSRCLRITVLPSKLQRSITDPKNRYGQPKRKLQRGRQRGSHSVSGDVCEQRKKAKIANSKPRQSFTFFDRRKVPSPLPFRQGKLETTESALARARPTAPAKSDARAGSPPGQPPGRAAPTPGTTVTTPPAQGEASQQHRPGTAEGAIAELSEASRRGLALGHSPVYLLEDAFAALYGRPARFSRRRWSRRLEQVLAKIDYWDRYHRELFGLDRAIELLVHTAYGGADVGAGQQPASLAFFVPLLEEIARDYRRWERPRRRAERKRRRNERTAAGGHVRRKIRAHNQQRAAEAARQQQEDPT